jgi:serine/threonine-protein kinase
MSPEALRGSAVDHRSDLFSVGVLLWEMITCRNLFESLSQQRQHIVPPLRQFAVWAPGSLQRIVERATAELPQHRYQSAESFAHELEDFRSEFFQACTRDIRHRMNDVLGAERTAQRIKIRAAIESIGRHMVCDDDEGVSIADDSDANLFQAPTRSIFPGPQKG